jgi:CDP-glycerol glycerophosphotransferase (TagB/SpsB family)
MNKHIDVIFYVAYPYYFPHFLPISKELESQKYSVVYVLSGKQNTQLMEKIAKEERLEYILGQEALYRIDAKVIFFANAFDDAKNLKAKTVFLCHGTGTKKCGFSKALEVHDIVLVEGKYRYKKYTKAYPQFSHKLHQVGYSKLDTVLKIPQEEIAVLKTKYHLKENRKTILYAPTFFPSSIEKMSDSFPQDFSEYNIIVKPHYLSWERKRYRKQQAKFKKWEEYDNCTVLESHEYDLIPLLAISDVMISDESAAIFEFASLNKPVIINRFLTLRWSYYFHPKKLLKRMDMGIDHYRRIGPNAQTYKEMVAATQKALRNTQLYEKERLSMTKEICGIVDGNVSKRIIKVIKGFI